MWTLELTLHARNKLACSEYTEKMGLILLASRAGVNTGHLERGGGQ